MSRGRRQHGRPLTFHELQAQAEALREQQRPPDYMIELDGEIKEVRLPPHLRAVKRAYPPFAILCRGITYHRLKARIDQGRTEAAKLTESQIATVGRQSGKDTAGRAWLSFLGCEVFETTEEEARRFYRLLQLEVAVASEGGP